MGKTKKYTFFIPDANLTSINFFLNINYYRVSLYFLPPPKSPKAAAFVIELTLQADHVQPIVLIYCLRN